MGFDGTICVFGIECVVIDGTLLPQLRPVMIYFHELFFCLCVMQYSRMHKLDPVENQIQCLKNDIKQLQADGVKPPPQSLAEAAVHTENFITSVHTQLFYVHSTF